MLVVKSNLHTLELTHKLRGSRIIAMNARSGLEGFPGGGEMDFMVVRTSAGVVLPNITFFTHWWSFGDGNIWRMF